MAKQRNMGETQRRSDNLVLVGYFLSRCSDFSDGKKSKPPPDLNVATWNDAYDLFFIQLSEGRPSQPFRHSLKGTRDIFDSLFENGRKGWSEGQKRGQELSLRDTRIHERWASRSDDELFDAVKAFIVKPEKVRKPDWTRDELLIVLDYHLKHRDFDPRPNSPEITELVERVAKVGDVLGISKQDTPLRSAEAIAMKLRNFSAHDQQYTANGRKGLQNGSALEAELWNCFSERVDEVSRLATRIVEASSSLVASEAIADDVEFEASEGRVLTRLHLSRERKRSLVERKKKSVLKRTGQLVCEICGFDFEKTYGERGKGFIECHHTYPVSSLSGKSKTKLSDLALVCSNCHRMIHVQRPWWSVGELKAVLQSSRNVSR
ncbi:5-methylcytosine-specific restriction enzyme A [Cohaesibacter sp. ES.047]|uniref:HNH endonuclease n=1 Tax=Cohaesibacter sp. ES.047 TaxID=1798205 RepID=UPI000BC0CFFB|nr:HNH endonuclease [Cohaesibacter sp. ES.047]SNY92309.1 5-methylcytosine-specific restriction enzyme A [Cohaesibacter sp. ES.047]